MLISVANSTEEHRAKPSSTRQMDTERKGMKFITCELQNFIPYEIHMFITSELRKFRNSEVHNFAPYELHDFTTSDLHHFWSLHVHEFRTSYLIHQKYFLADSWSLCTSRLSLLKHRTSAVQKDEEERRDRRKAEGIGSRKKRKRLVLRQ